MSAHASAVGIDVMALRAMTPGCALGAHFNHAGASLMSSATLAAVSEQLQREALYGPMEAAVTAQEAVAAAREDAAALIGAKAAEIAFTSSGSAAWGMAFAALPPLRPGARILAGRQEWGGNLASMHAAAARAGAVVEVIPSREDGSVDPQALANRLDRNVHLISLTWLPANGGLINDASAVGAIARAANIPYFIDAGQALGQLPIDVAELGCDVLKGAGRKFLRGPRGTALLYVRGDFNSRLTPMFVDVLSSPWIVDDFVQRDDARRFETSECSVALLCGLGNALRECRATGIAAIRERIVQLATHLRHGLTAIPRVNLHDLGTTHSGLVAFTIDGVPASGVRANLAVEGIAIGANGVPYTPLDMLARGLHEIARASVSYINTDEEIDRLLQGIAAIAARAPITAICRH